MFVTLARRSARKPERRPLDRPRLRLRVSQDRDGPALDDEGQGRAAEQHEQERRDEGGQRRRDWRAARRPRSG